MWLRKSRKEPVLSHISMKNLPESERPYERFQILGAEALSDAELLAIILKTGTKDYCGAFQAHCQNRTRISFIHELSVFHRRLLYGRTPAPQGRGLYGSFL